jgi:hypothetical protein
MYYLILSIVLVAFFILLLWVSITIVDLLLPFKGRSTRIAAITVVLLALGTLLLQCLASVEYDSPPLKPLDVEITEWTRITGRLLIGELEVKYPVAMRPDTSDMIEVTVRPDVSYVRPAQITRVEIPLDDNFILGARRPYTTTIIVDDVMRMSLTSLSFTVEELIPVTQTLGLNTRWAWTLKAPSTPGTHIFTIRAFHQEFSQPAWVGSFLVEVANPTPTPSPTSTPVPTTERIKNEFVDNSPSVFATCLTFIAAMATLYVTHQNNKRQAMIKKLEQENSATAQQQEAEKERLNAEIERLKSIRWWQVWRK